MRTFLRRLPSLLNLLIFGSAVVFALLIVEGVLRVEEWREARPEDRINQLRFNDAEGTPRFPPNAHGMHVPYGRNKPDVLVTINDEGFRGAVAQLTRL